MITMWLLNVITICYEKMALVEWAGKKHVSFHSLINRKQVGSEIGFLVVYTKLFSDVVAVNIDGPSRHLEMLCQLFSGFSLFYHVCD